MRRSCSSGVVAALGMLFAGLEQFDTLIPIQHIVNTSGLVALYSKRQGAASECTALYSRQHYVHVQSNDTG